MDDLISRKALCEYALNQKDKSITPNDIMRFPSAQPEERTEERMETHACDLISRQAAIDAMNTITKWALLDRNGYHVGVGMKYRDVKETVKNLPPSPSRPHKPTASDCWGCNCPKMQGGAV